MMSPVMNINTKILRIRSVKEWAAPILADINQDKVKTIVINIGHRQDIYKQQPAPQYEGLAFLSANGALIGVPYTFEVI